MAGRRRAGRRITDTLPAGWRQPIFGDHQRQVVLVLCGWEVAALAPGSPLPTLSSIVRRARPVGVVIVGLLVHHWFVEAVREAVAVALEEANT